jgi:ribosomal protein S18 acetylase RimI-like enzyme
MEIRPYRDGDREQVRRIAFETGYMGEPCDWYWRHAESFADVWTGYYTDREPESAFVAADGDTVLGYLVGCADTARAPKSADQVVRQMLRRQLFLRPGTAGFFWRAFWDTLRDRGTPSGEVHDPRWPAHLPINLLPEARGRGAGRGLMSAWLGRLRTLGVPGCHLGTMAENTNGIRFFESVGFARQGEPRLVPGMRTRAGARMHVQMMVRSIRAP